MIRRGGKKQGDEKRDLEIWIVGSRAKAANVRVTAVAVAARVSNVGRFNETTLVLEYVDLRAASAPRRLGHWLRLARAICSRAFAVFYTRPDGWDALAPAEFLTVSLIDR